MTILLLLAALTRPPTDPVLVIVNKPTATVSLLNLATGLIAAALPTGDGPHETAASPDGRWAVVSDYGAKTPGHTLTVVDLTERRVARTIELGFQRPHGLAFLPDGKTVAVTSETAGMVALVNVATGTVVSSHPTSQAVSHMLAVTRDGARAYTANIRSGSISAVDLAGVGPARSLPVGTMTEAIGLTPDGGEAWLGSNNTGKVYAVDVAGWRVADSMQTSGFPYRIAFAPDGRTAIITNPMSDEIHLYDVATRARKGTVPAHGSNGAQGEPLAAVFTRNGATAYISLGGAGEILELDVAGMRVRRYFPAGEGPDGLALVEPAP